MSSLARAATSTTFPIVAPSRVTTASPVLTAVHAICSSAMRLIIEPVQLGGLDRRGLSEDEQEDRFASQALCVLVHRNRPASAGHDKRRGRAQGELGGASALLGHRLWRTPIEGISAVAEFGHQFV